MRSSAADFLQLFIVYYVFFKFTHFFIPHYVICLRCLLSVVFCYLYVYTHGMFISTKIFKKLRDFFGGISERIFDGAPVTSRGTA